MYFATPIEAISMISAFLVCGYALWRGERPERIAGFVLLANWVITSIIDVNSNLMEVHLGVLAIDAVAAAIFLVLALSSRRFWPLWVAGFQIFEVSMHLAMLADPKVHARAYYVGLEISSYLILIALGVGVWLEAPRGRLTLLRTKDRAERYRPPPRSPWR